MQASILTDTEAETTVELDESALIQASQPTNVTKSIFNITLNDGMYPISLPSHLHMLLQNKYITYSRPRRPER